jgi:hypothetical protein
MQLGIPEVAVIILLLLAAGAIGAYFHSIINDKD